MLSVRRTLFAPHADSSVILSRYSWSSEASQETPEGNLETTSTTINVADYTD